LRKFEARKAQARATLGAPVYEDSSPDGRSSLIYAYPVPLTDSNKTIKMALVVLIFDSRDVLMQKAVYGRNADGPIDTHDLAAISANAFAKPLPPVLLLPSPPPPQPGSASLGGAPEAENLLLPVPNGFKAGSNQDQPGVQRMTEYLPLDETFANWSRLITVDVFHRLHSVDPDQLPAGMRPAWKSSCPGAQVDEVAKSTINGYAATLWLFQCPLNPNAGKPENMWIKVISGADALYAVQYAFHQPITDLARTEALTYLNGVTACDSRSAAHPCENLKRVQ